MLFTPLNLAYAFIALNFAAFAAFGIDKSRAERGEWRIAESTLLGLAFLGGSPGAYAGRHLFRHKTRKQPFVGTLHTIAALQVLALAGLAGWWIYRGHTATAAASDSAIAAAPEKPVKHRKSRSH